MNKYNNPSLTSTSQSLRKSMTKEERRLWNCFLRQLPITINRQKVIGNYILDFYYAKGKIAIELDGSQHNESHGKEKDMERDSWLKSQGIIVLRYSNREVNQNFRGVCEDIMRYL